MQKITQEEFSEYVRHMRKSTGLTQKEMGRRMGLKSSTLGTYEQGKSKPIDMYEFLVMFQLEVRKELKKKRKAEAV